MQKPLPPVLLAAMALELGGAETHVISLARELKLRGHQVVVASAGGHMVPMLTGAGIPHETVPMDSRSPVAMLRAYLQLRKVMARYRIGLVHAHARIPAFITALAVRDRGVPFVTTYHGVYNAAFPWRLLTTFGRRTISVSQDVKAHLIGPLGAPAGQIRVIPNGFDTNLFHPGVDIAPLLSEFGVQAAGPHVVNAGRLDGQLADVPLALLAGVEQMERELPGARLWILGDGDRAQEVRSQVEAANRRLGRSVAVATGIRLDVPRFFNLADCVVAVARTALEAMACGRPVIVAGEGGYGGILLPERIGEWVQMNFTARGIGVAIDPARLAADVIQLCRPEAAAERRRLGEAGRAFVVGNLSIAAIVDRILDVYAEVL